MAVLNIESINAKAAAQKKLRNAIKESRTDKLNAVLNAFNKYQQRAIDIFDTYRYAADHHIHIETNFKGIRLDGMSQSFKVSYEPIPNVVVFLHYFPKDGTISAGRCNHGCFEDYKYPVSNDIYTTRCLCEEKSHGTSYVDDLIKFADKFPEYIILVEEGINRL
jgi:hypothetical protein